MNPFHLDPDPLWNFFFFYQKYNAQYHDLFLLFRIWFFASRIRFMKRTRIHSTSKIHGYTGRPSKSVRINWWHYKHYLSIPLYTISWCERFRGTVCRIKIFGIMFIFMRPWKNVRFLYRLAISKYVLFVMY